MVMKNSKGFVIGIGGTGCRIAKEFQGSFQGYDVFYFDTSNKSMASKTPLKNVCLKTPSSLDGYENILSKNRAKTIFKSFKPHDDVIVFVESSGKMSLSTLSILENIKYCDIRLFLIKSDLDFESKEKKDIHFMVFTALQEYARSGLFRSITLLDNKIFEKIIGQVALKKFYKQINHTIAWYAFSIHNLDNIEPDMTIGSNFKDPFISTRIQTIAVVDLEGGEETPFFFLDNMNEKLYYYNISTKRMNEDTELLHKIKEQMKRKAVEDLVVSCGIFESDTDFSFCLMKTQKVQK